ncbi:MAG: hypothetical protein M1817_002008 [Caeruleum heppii]|nr:MAG: hypothetical protein M1817_002008 [Caeruleum heppii]
MSKTLPGIVKTATRGEIRHPPFEPVSSIELKAEMDRFEVWPIDRISAYPKHIPYNSEKKTFLDKTGRESFEVFQYTFKLPGEDKTHVVMWDYNIGLVRVTPFFKCCKYSKTTPAKMLNSNAGLRDISHSITGGALAAQGYWLPFEAARAVCITFCHPIRYALVPLFGPEFPGRCTSPGDAAFGRMVIDQAVVRRSAATAKHYRLLEQSPATPDASPARNVDGVKDDEKPDDLKPRHLRPKRERRHKLKARQYSESGYGTETDADPATKSRTITPPGKGSGWTCFSRSTPRSFKLTTPAPPKGTWLPPTPTTPTPSPLTPTIPRKRGFATTTVTEYDGDTPPESDDAVTDKDVGGDTGSAAITEAESIQKSSSGRTQKRRKISDPQMQEDDADTMAAYALLQLFQEDQRMSAEESTKKTMKKKQKKGGRCASS